MLDVHQLMEMAFVSALMHRSSVPISFKILPSHILPRPLAAIEHVIVHVSRQGVVFYAAIGIISHPLSELRRFPMVGEIFSNISPTLPDNGVFECIIDLGDGNDAGDYRRIAYSSARSDTVLVPDPYFYMFDNYDALRQVAAHQTPPWRERRNVLFWRGTAGGATGTGPGENNRPDPGEPSDWGWLPRLKLCAAARNSKYAGMIDAALSSHRQIEQKYLREAIERAGFLRQSVTKDEFLKYRYLVDIDGWTNSWSLLDKMITGATIFKVQSASGFRQWFYDRLHPWTHYIPLASDISDLDDKIAWALSHQDECEQIAANSAALAADIQLRPELAKAEQAISAILTPAT
ncbi:glycosyl transferase family 90 [Telmatospirillum sp.]|uniref:glycosyl transferase family 90 n=1 Tax=Telmatospirillum sp. TaxID=2079197 RepID=UPI00285062C8|nr:glycosyl transferase family 90 [Telmatospirillum sp.]MDR3437625.1 glycosyl transferase family 90 [Telmatospirillum sp.]